MIFKIYNCDFGFTYNSVNYKFDHVESLQVDDPEFTRLTRGGNAGNKTGLVYKEGVKDPKTVTCTVIGMTAEIHNLLKTIFESQARVELFCIDKSDGSQKTAKQAILCQPPQQLNIDETPESMNTALIFQSYDAGELHKS